LSAGVHVVEVDLVRAGNWRAVMLPERCPAKGVSTYRAVLRTSGERPAGYLYPITLRQPLPEIPIPLRPKDKPVPLPLQTLLEAVYEDGRYDQTIDYGQPLHPPLSADDEAWMQGLLQSAGKR
jgi:hypothetical protein